MTIDSIVYFGEDTGWKVGGIPLISCLRCAALVYDSEISRDQHIGFHRGWWVRQSDGTTVDEKHVWRGV